MLAAGHQAQAEAGLVQRHIGSDERDERHEHEPVEFKRADRRQKRILCAAVLHDGRNVVGVGSGVDGLDNDRRTGGAEQVQRRADERLVGLEVDARHGKQAGIDHADQRGDKDDREDHHDRRGCIRHIAHCQRAAERTHDHNAFEAEVDNAGMLREAAAEGDQDQNRREDQRILKQQDHSVSPPFLASARVLAFAMAFSSRRAAMELITFFMNRTKPHR